MHRHQGSTSKVEKASVRSHADAEYARFWPAAPGSKAAVKTKREKNEMMCPDELDIMGKPFTFKDKKLGQRNFGETPAVPLTILCGSAHPSVDWLITPQQKASFKMLVLQKTGILSKRDGRTRSRQWK